MSLIIFAIVGGFIVFDIVTGLIKALNTGGVNSTLLRKGLYHKLTEIISLVGAYLLEYAITYIQLGFDVPMFKAVASYICLMELVSVLENISEVNPTMGNFFSKYLEKLGDNNGKSKNRD